MRTRSSVSASGLLGPLLGVAMGLMACATASAGLVFKDGIDKAAENSSDYAALRLQNFANFDKFGTVLVGLGSGLESDDARGNNTTVDWAQQLYKFTFTYDPKQQVAVTTWIGKKTGEENRSFQFLKTDKGNSPNELTVFLQNTERGSLILTLDGINAVVLGGELAGEAEGTFVKGGTASFEGAKWGARPELTSAFLWTPNCSAQGLNSSVP